MPRREVRKVPEGYEVRRKLGRDEVEGVVRLELKFTLEEWERIEEEAAEKDSYPRAWIMSLIQRKLK